MFDVSEPMCVEFKGSIRFIICDINKHIIVHFVSMNRRYTIYLSIYLCTDCMLSVTQCIILHKMITEIMLIHINISIEEQVFTGIQRGYTILEYK